MVYQPKDDDKSSFSYLLSDPVFYNDDDSCINYDDDSSEFNKQEDLHDTFNNGSDNEPQPKEDTPTPAESSVGFLKIAKSTVGVLGERSVGFLEMAKSTVGVLGEKSGGFLETAKSNVGVLGERSGGFLETAKTVGVVGGTAIAAGWSLYCLLSSSDSSPSPSPSSSSEKEKKKMKAPGRKGKKILRESFEANPSKYFSDKRKGLPCEE